MFEYLVGNLTSCFRRNWRIKVEIGGLLKSPPIRKAQLGNKDSEVVDTIHEVAECSSADQPESQVGDQSFSAESSLLSVLSEMQNNLTTNNSQLAYDISQR